MSAVEAVRFEDTPERQADYEAWLVRKAKMAKQGVNRAERIETDDLVPEVTLKAQRWTLDDKAAAALAEGRCFKVSLVLRAEGVWQYRDGRRWKTTLLELEGIGPDQGFQEP